MKTKNLKLLASFLLLLPFCAVLLGAGCKKVEESNYDPTSIIGKWEWIYSVSGGIGGGTTYQTKGQIRSLIFTRDSTFIEFNNGKHTSGVHFRVSGDTLKYHIDGANRILQIEINNDTLSLREYIILYPIFKSYYKRIK